MSVTGATHRFGGVLVILAIGGGALAMGAQDVPVLAVMSLAVAVACAVLLWQMPAGVPSTNANVLVWLGVGLTSFTALQMVPLPPALLAALSPHAARVWSDAYHFYGEQPTSWMTLTTDPVATNVEVVKGTAYLATFAACGALLRARAERMLYIALLGCAALVVVVAAVHLSLDADRAYGFYESKSGLRAYSAFLNANHFGAYVNIGLILAMAGGLSDQPPIPRPILIACAALFGAAQVWIASRGAIGAGLVGIVLLVAMRVRRWSDDGVKRAAPILIGLAGVALLAFGSSGTLGEVADTDTSKVRSAWHALRSMAAAYPLAGSGRGSFESAYAEFSTTKGFVVWTHPENIVVQWISEWGLPVGTLAFGALAFALRPEAHVVRSRLRGGAWVLLIVIGLQNLVDYNSEVPAMGMALAAAAAIVTSGLRAPRRASSASKRTCWEIHPRVFAVAILSTTVLANVLLLARSGHELVTERLVVKRLLDDDKTSGAELQTELRRATFDHPAEPYFAYVGALRATDRGDENPLPWLERTLTLAPVYPPAHLVLARVLRRASPSQARLEYRLYAEQMGSQPLDSREVSNLVTSVDEALELAPAGTTTLLEELSLALALRLPATAEAIDAEILARDPGATEALTRTARHAVDDVDSESWCDGARRDACLGEAELLVSRLLQLEPRRCDAQSLHASLLVLRGDIERAIRDLREAGEVASDPALCATTRAEIATNAGRIEDATAAISAVAAAPCGTGWNCTDNLLAAAALEDRRQRPAQALAYSKIARDRAPENDGVVAEFADRAARLGLHVEAADAYEGLAKKHPQRSDYRSLADAERSATVLRPH